MAKKEMKLAGMVKASSESIQKANEIVVDESINNELNSKQIERIDISKIYSAPNQWNNWKSISDEKMVELMKSIIDVGQLQPCILWKVDKETMRNFYEKDEYENDTYGFTGTEYMILVGHNRANARKTIALLDDYLDDEEYETVPSIVFDDDISTEFIEKVRNIIDDSNYLSRDKSPKEVMNVIRRKYIALNDSNKIKNEKGITKKIAESLNLSERSVFRYLRLNDELVPDVLELVYSEKLSIRDALNISAYPEEIQQYVFDNYEYVLKNKKKTKWFLDNSTVDISESEIDNLLLQTEEEYVKVMVTIPVKYKNKLIELTKQWREES